MKSLGGISLLCTITCVGIKLSATMTGNKLHSQIIFTIEILIKILGASTCMFNLFCIVPQLSKCLKFEAVWGVLTDQMI